MQKEKCLKCFDLFISVTRKQTDGTKTYVKIEIAM